MSNIKQALESAIEWVERYADRHGYHTDGLLLINKLKISLDELEKCEPVAYLKFISRQWLVSPEIGMDGFEGFEVCDKYGKGDDGADAFAVYTSPQPIEKCEPVAYIHTATNTDKDGVEWVQLKAIDTSPQPRDCEDWQYFDKAYKKAAETSDATDWMNAALLAQQVRRNQLNTKG